MKINILGTTKEYENSRQQIDDMFEYIEKSIWDSKLILSHLEIDGLEVYSDFSNYFVDNIRNINEVNVITRTEKEMYKENIVSTLDYTERAIPEIEILSNEFYQTPTGDTWNKMIQLIEGLNWIIASFSSIDSKSNLKDLVDDYEEWNIYAKDIYSLKELVLELDKVIKNNDLVAIGDILAYEVSPLFNQAKETLKKLI
ncbi:hypothetical protein [Alkaliphilus oremlandii]|uniref:Uncharacterized protein n=1 Tax=Alkaliphilus oremlandii (strain OhILAs) TaxID=350688 RepID=A8MJR5_ALKOO|nr:hypothetical protein [Alkaliphilus oremlandii]ABW20047.1 hypothetical protein Clos_2516 [Alkaliphilus oremlandii OhILAs]